MGNETSRHRPQTILYVAATDEAARSGATALERVPAGPKRAVRPTTSVERVRNWAPNVDCVVFAETPTTPAGAHLLEVADACGSTPLVLFSESAYGATAARSTDGIDGYVRRDTDNAIAHLADELTWLCYGDDNAVTAAESTTLSTQASSVLAAAADLIARRDRDRLLERLVEATVEAIDTDRCWIATVNFGELVPQTTAAGVDATAIEPVSTGGPLGEAFRAGESLRLPDLEARTELESPWSDARSLCSVPIADLGVLQVAADTSEAFDDADVSLLESLCAVTAAVLERNRAEARLTAERDRLQNELDDRTSERNRLADEQAVIGQAAEHLAAERDRFRAAFSSAPLPMLRYEIDGHHSNADTARDARPDSVSDTNPDSDPDQAPKAVITDINTAFETTFGEERDTVVGQPVSNYTVPSGVRDRATALTEALRAGDRRELDCRRETTDGIREFSVTVVPLERAARDRRSGDEIEPRTGTGPTTDSAPIDHPTGILYFTDITDRTRTQRALTAATRRLDTIATLLEDEVQTPLNVARGYLELVEKTGDSDHFEVIDDAHLQLTDHVESLYELAATDEILADTEPVAIHDVARRAWLTVDTGNAELVVESTLMLEADRARLHNLFESVLQLVAGNDSENGTGTVPSSVTVTVGATEDGFYVARDGPAADDPRFDPASEDPGKEGAAAADSDGTAHRSTATTTATATDPDHPDHPDHPDADGARELVEQIADAHNWDVGIAADEARTAFAFRGVDAIDL